MNPDSRAPPGRTTPQRSGSTASAKARARRNDSSAFPSGCQWEPCRVTQLRGPTKQAGVSNVVPATPIGGGAMTTVANLLARKQRLVATLHRNYGPSERADNERLLAQVDAAWDRREEVGPPRRAKSHRRL